MIVARLLIRLSAILAPADCRHEWRREWLAELEAGVQHGRSALAFALGAPRHALALRRETWRPSLVAADVRFGVRMLRRRPGFAGAAIVTLALGIGATTAIFSVVDGVLLAPLPYRAPDRLVELWETNPLFGWDDATRTTVAPGNLLSWRDRNQVFADIAWYLGSGTRAGGLTSVTLGGSDPERLQTLPVSANFFDVLGVRPMLGRTFLPGEDRPGHSHEIVLSNAFWHTHFSADASVVGRSALINGNPFTVIGVMAPSFAFDSAKTDFWAPLAMDPAQVRDTRRPHYLRAVARLKPGVTAAQARANLNAIAADLEREHPDTNRQMRVGVGPVDDWFVGQSRRPLWLFLAAVGLVLLIACGNVASLLLSRAGERAREMSLRAALGAGRSRLVRQLLIESLVIAAAGALVGVAFAAAGIRLFLALAPAGLPRVDNVAMRPAVVAFTCGLTALTALLVGLLPATQAARRDLRTSLGDDGRVTPGRGRRIRQVAVAGQVALAVVLLVGATLAVRSFQALVDVDPGLPVDGLVTAKVSLPNARYGKDGQADAFFQTASSRLRALPGVTAAGATAKLPLEGSSWTGDLFIRSQPERHYRELRHKSVTPGYLEALGVRLAAGRTIQPGDDAAAPLVVVVNESFARRFFPAGDAVGREVTFDQPKATSKWRTIIGVVGNVSQDGLGVPPVPEVYQPNAQEEFSDLAFVVRASVPPAEVIADIRRVVRSIDPQLAVFDAEPFGDLVGQSVARPRFAASLISLFAIVALALAAVGVYGVAAYAVSLRTREIGVRRAFGATGGDVLRLIVRQQLGLIAAGLVVGAALAAAASRMAASLLFQTAPTDLASYAVALGVLAVAGAVATLAPARRAMKIDPVIALRVE